MTNIDYEGIDKMNLVKIIPKQQHTYFEDKANEILSKYDVKNPYDIGLYNIIGTYKNLKVFFMNQNSKVVLRKNIAIIIVNEKLSSIEKRLELAEEFCHYILHLGNQLNYSSNYKINK
ncbi:MAG: ImmA/IrrE family metallo-endopeptidase [Firmicutes bacterium]|nr:ImmA/IrrE family metallo-endopeptidase [Bacillota bacterium]